MFSDDNFLLLLTWMDSKEPHPYFGISSHENSAEMESLKAAPRLPTDFVVLLVGGSVTRSVSYELSRRINETLKRIDPSLRSKNIKFVNMAIGAGKQPQQFFEVAYALDRIDLVIEMSGHNEIVPLKGREFLPPEFPYIWLRFFRPSEGNLFYRGLAFTLKQAFIAQAWLGENFWPLRHSLLYFHVWGPGRILLFNFENWAEKKYLASLNLPVQHDPFAPEQIRAYADIWRKYVELSAWMLRTHGVRYFCFSQPNQYLAGSKPMGPEEREIAIQPQQVEDEARRMSAIYEQAAALAKRGPPFYNLMDLFRNESRPLYVDDCCHMNQDGISLVVDAILNTIQRDWNAPGVMPARLR